jgi:DNA-directed RNA polymerase specialized sigma24 family protein
MRTVGGKKLQEIAEVFGISRERVRQILLPQQYCEKHDRTYTIADCRKCRKEKEREELLAMFPPAGRVPLSSLVDPSLVEQLQQLRPSDRRQSVVQRRDMMILYLRDIKKLSFPAIGELLDRDHTTIMSSYYRIKPHQQSAVTNI